MKTSIIQTICVFVLMALFIGKFGLFMGLFIVLFYVLGMCRGWALRKEFETKV